MKLLAAVCVVGGLGVAAVVGHAQDIDRDFGSIVRSTPTTVAVVGLKGRHVLIPRKACEWCKRGARVVLTFEGAGRGTLAPDAEFAKYDPVPVLVLERGRAQR